jgi:hypothetical protein
MLVAYDDRLTEHLVGVLHPERPIGCRVVARELERRYLGHRDPKHTVHYTRVAAGRFEGLGR